MSAPKLSTPRSGYSGRGYVNPWTGEVVPSITNCIGALEAPGIVQWSVDQTVSRMAVDFERLKDSSAEDIFRRERFGLSRAKSADFDDPMFEWTQAYSVALNELADLGTRVHDWIEADLLGHIEPDIYSKAQEEMVIEWLNWKADQDIVVHAIEATVYGDRYAGTADLFWNLNGVNRLDDIKTSKAVRDSHVAQLAALGASDLLAKEVPADTEGAVGHKPRKADKEFSSWWVKDVLPPVEAYGILQLRPTDWDKMGYEIAPFCTLHDIPQERIDAGFELFIASRDARYAQKKLNDVTKRLEKEVF